MRSSSAATPDRRSHDSHGQAKDNGGGKRPLKGRKQAGATRARRKKRRATQARTRTSASARLTPEAAVAAIGHSVAQVVRGDYRSRFVVSFRIAATWSNGRPTDPADQIRNAFDHLSKASAAAMKITKLLRSRSPSNISPGKISSLYHLATRHVLFAKRHITLGHYLAIDFTINTIVGRARDVLETLAINSGHPFETEWAELERLYGKYDDLEPASTTRSMKEETLKAAIASTASLAAQLNAIAKDLTEFYEALDALIR